MGFVVLGLSAELTKPVSSCQLQSHLSKHGLDIPKPPVNRTDKILTLQTFVLQTIFLFPQIVELEPANVIHWVWDHHSALVDQNLLVNTLGEHEGFNYLHMNFVKSHVVHHFEIVRVSVYLSKFLGNHSHEHSLRIKVLIPRLLMMIKQKHTVILQNRPFRGIRKFLNHLDVKTQNFHQRFFSFFLAPSP